jgi:hypothetical protein
MTITILRNTRKRRKSVFWPIAKGCVMVIAPGEQFAIDDSDLDSPGLRDALAVLIKIGWIAVDAEGLEPVRH